MEKRELLTLADFENLVQETFVFSIDNVEQTIEGELVSAELLTSGSHQGMQREPFRLLFRFPSGANLGQHLFTAEHPKLGATSIFIVPIFENEEGWFMEAIYN